MSCRGIVRFHGLVKIPQGAAKVPGCADAPCWGMLQECMEVGAASNPTPLSHACSYVMMHRLPHTRIAGCQISQLPAKVSAVLLHHLGSSSCMNTRQVDTSYCAQVD